jgi:hypothetical protein
MKPLVIPPAAQRDDQSIQMLSAWIAERGFHCTLNIGYFAGYGHDEVEAWGIILADLIRHIGNALMEERGTPAKESVNSVLASLSRELDLPTSGVVGAFHVGHS